MFNNINKIKQLITAMGCEIDWCCENIISVDNDLWRIIINEESNNDIFLDLNMEIGPLKAADIYKRLTYLASLIDLNVVINNVYAHVFDEDGDIIDMTFGDEAYETVGRKRCYGVLR